jgi:hypothetical protein
MRTLNQLLTLDEQDQSALKQQRMLHALAISRHGWLASNPNHPRGSTVHGTLRSGIDNPGAANGHRNGMTTTTDVRARDSNERRCSERFGQNTSIAAMTLTEWPND